MPTIPQPPHGGTPELAAAVTAARALLADFQRAAREFTVAGTSADWLSWALRLDQRLQHVLNAIAEVNAG